MIESAFITISCAYWSKSIFPETISAAPFLIPPSGRASMLSFVPKILATTEPPKSVILYVTTFLSFLSSFTSDANTSPITTTFRQDS